MSDVMIVPLARVQTVTSQTDLTVHQQNWRFAQQWKAQAPTQREVIELAITPASPRPTALVAFRDAFRRAGQLARGKEVILFVGHGGATQSGRTQTVFDLLPEPGPLSSHTLAFTREVLDLPLIARKSGGSWTPTPEAANRGTSQRDVDVLSPRFDAMCDAAQSMVQGGVKRFTVLSCNVGRDLPFAQDFATRVVGLETRMYKGWVSVREVTFGTRVLEQIWITLDHDHPENDAPPDTDETHASFHEVPTRHELVVTPRPLLRLQWLFPDGGNVKHGARLEENVDGSQTLTIENAVELNGDFKGLAGFDAKAKTLTVTVHTKIDAKAKLEPKGPPRGFPRAHAYVAYALLYWFCDKANKKKLGDWVTAEINGRRVIVLFEEHPPDKGIAKPHPGCSLKDGGPLNQPGATAS
jgi:hypothetical protein